MPPVMRHPRGHGGIPNPASAFLPVESRLFDDRSHQSCQGALYPHGAYPPDCPTHSGGLPVWAPGRQAGKGPICVTRGTLYCGIEHFPFENALLTRQRQPPQRGVHSGENRVFRLNVTFDFQKKSKVLCSRPRRSAISSPVLRPFRSSWIRVISAFVRLHRQRFGRERASASASTPPTA